MLDSMASFPLTFTVYIVSPKLRGAGAGRRCPSFYIDQRSQAAGRRVAAQSDKVPENKAAGRRSSNREPWIWVANPPSNKNASLSVGL